MRSLRGMIGIPVVCSGRRVGRVVQADIAEDLRRLDGIWVNAGFRGTRYIPSESLELIGETAIIADTRGIRRRADDCSLFRRAISTDGRRLGAITGAEFDEMSFCVSALELSAGLWDDLLNGRQRISRFAVRRETGEVIVDWAGHEMEAEQDEGWYDESPDYGHADRRIGGDHIRRSELADGEELEPQGQADWELDLRPCGRSR